MRFLVVPAHPARRATFGMTGFEHKIPRPTSSFGLRVTFGMTEIPPVISTRGNGFCMKQIVNAGRNLMI